MRRALGFRRAFGLGLAAVAACLAITSAGAVDAPTYGVAVSKGCSAPTYVGQPYLCFYVFGNNNQNVTSGDTVKLTSVVDQVNAASGPVVSPNILSGLELVGTAGANGGPTCTGPGISGDGSMGNPWKGATECQLPYGSTIGSFPFSHYNPTVADYNASSGHKLNDQGTFSWVDLCDKTPDKATCDPVAVNQNQAPASTTLRLYTPSISTLLSASAIGAGGTVHDTAQVTITPTPPTVSGTVTYNLYTDSTCTTPSSNPSLNQTVPYTGGTVPNSQDVTFPNAGNFWFQATFSGDDANGIPGPVTSACTSEPLTVVDAKISITPNGTNAVGSPHVFTAHVDVNPGTGFVPAANAVVNFTIAPGGVGTLTPSSCTTNALGNCTVTDNSSVSGTDVVTATTTVSVGGVSLTRATDGTHGSSGPATKNWVAAKISIAPDATNEVGHSHTFTVTLQKNTGSGFVAAAGEHVSVTLTDSNGASHGATSGTCTNAGANTDASGQCTITFSSPSAGKVTGHATATLSVNGVSITVSTNGVAPNSGDAVKTYVDANIQITPATATNRVGTNHTLTVHVNVNDGSGGFTNAPAGTLVTLTKISGPGSFVGGNTCTTVGSTGSCTAVITSATTGTTVIQASTTVIVGGVSLTRTTNGVAPNSGNANKTWVNAKISIAPNATNEVGQPHTFVVTLSKDTGTGTFVPAAGEHVDVTLTDSKGAAHSAPTGTCTNAGANTNASGQCTITFTSPTAGMVSGHATATLTVGGVPIIVATDGTGGNSGDAVKTFVDANIQITPATGVNRIGDNHVLTGHVNVNAGNGAGYVNAPNGTVISFAKVSGPGSFVGGVNTCTVTGGTGSCTVAITSPTTGTTVVRASTSVTVGGVVLVRSTGPAPSNGNSADAQKTWVNAKITIAPDATNEVGQPHTFTVTVSKDLGSGFVVAAGVHVDVTLTDSNGASHTAPTGTCTNAGPNTDASGQCTISFTSPSPGKVTGHATATIDVNGVPITVSTDGIAPNSGDAVKTFVDANIQITPAEASNQLGTNHVLTGHVNVNAGGGAGYVNAPDGTAISFSILSGPGSFVNNTSTCVTAGGTGSCTVAITSTTTGTTIVRAATNVTVGGVLLHRETGDGKAGDSADAQKHWVSARISITPNATNEVGQPHTFTVTLEKNTGSGFVPAAGEHVTVTLTDAKGAAHTAPTGSCTNAGANTDAAGQCTITFTSPTPGMVTGHASATVTVDGLSTTVETDGTGGNSGDAVKTFVDANIQITPATAFNKIGTNHTLTGHVNVNAGGGAGYVNAPAGTVINFSIQSGPGSFVGGANVCTTSGASGSCSVQITSSSTGTTVVRASTNIVVGGVLLHRATGDGHAGDSADAQKTWENAKISIAPRATNEVGQPHTFVVTLSKDTGSGFVPAPGEHVDVTLSDSLGASHTAPTGTCTNAGANTDASGQCTITFTSPTPGKVTGHAFATLSVNGVSISVATDGVAPNSGDAVKTFVDANIQITPATAFNKVGTNHTLTGHVNVNAGGGAGYVNAPDGTVINFSIQSGPGSFVGGVNTCATAGGTGSCTVQITSGSTGTTVVRASTSVTVSGVSMSRSTGDAHAGDSADAQKSWVNAKIVITPTATNEVGHPHTFVATLLKDPGTGIFVAAPGESLTVTLTPMNGASPVPPGPFSCTTNAAGSCLVTVTSATPGKVAAHASATLTVNGVTMTVQTDGTDGNSTDAVKTWVDANIQITPAAATNPTGTNHVLTGHVNVNAGGGAGYVNAPDGTVINFSIQSGPGSFVGGVNSCTTTGGTGSCTVAITSPTAGTTVVRDTTTVNVAGLLLTRSSGDGKAGDSADATKTWVGAKITIAPDATNEVGQPHTFTVTLSKDTGTGTFVPAAGEHVTVTLTDSDGASHTPPIGTCTNALVNTDANGQCKIVFTSPTAGKVTGHAASTLTIGSSSVTVSTNGVAPNSGDAVKTFVDARISVTPATASNPVGTNHVLTGHVEVNAGNGAGFVNAPDGTAITFSIVSGPGSFVGGVSSCTTGGGTGSCTVTITSSTVGTTIVKAATDVTVGGVPLHRETSDGKSGDGDNASKIWRDVSVVTHVLDANGADVTGKTVPSGSAVHDTVTVTGIPSGGPTPTGNVTFTLYKSASCDPESGVVGTETTGLNGSGTATSSDSPALTEGSYGYRASYAGDSNYPAGTGECEPFTVGPTTTPCPDGSFTVKIDPVTGDANIVYDQFPAPNDNSYGVNAVGWGGHGHKFNDLVGSDHAGFQVLSGSGTDVLDFNIDYLSQKSGTPSGYASLGPFGGDGKVNKGSLSASDLTWDTSLARNLNDLGYFSGGTQTVGTGVALLTKDSPPTLNTIDDYTLTPAAAAAFSAGWDFHDTYFVTIKASKLLALGAIEQVGGKWQLKSGWTIGPNVDQLHNSPAKPCPCVIPGGTGPTSTTTLTTFDGQPAYALTYTQSLATNDNSYSTTKPTVFWGTNQHKFNDLVGSDKAEFVIKNGAQTLFDFTLDYISQSPSDPSGFGSLGPFGGDGSFATGDKSAILGWTTSLDDDLNNVNVPGLFSTDGHHTQLIDPNNPNVLQNSPSPVDSGDETKGAQAPFGGWDYRNSYTVYIKASALPANFDGSMWSVPNLHNSPAKKSVCP